MRRSLRLAPVAGAPRRLPLAQNCLPITAAPLTASALEPSSDCMAGPKPGDRARLPQLGRAFVDLTPSITARRAPLRPPPCNAWRRCAERVRFCAGLRMEFRARPAHARQPRPASEVVNPRHAARVSLPLS